MTIKDAIERTAPPKSLRSGKAIDEALDARRKLETDYERLVLQKGIYILTDSGVVDILDELREIINSGPNGKKDATTEDVNTSFPSDRDFFSRHTRRPERFVLHDYGTVATGIGWDYDDDRKGNPITHPTHKGFFVEAQPLTGALVVQIHLGSEFIPRETWEGPGGREIVEDAIARAYKKPARWSRPAHIG